MTTTIVVDPLPAAISGEPSVCLGSTRTLSSATSGGTWFSSNTTVATINSSGVVTSLALGTTTITYTIATGCYITVEFTVYPTLPFISGSTLICGVGNTTTLTNAVSGGTWTSSNTGVATVGLTTGVVTAVGYGASIIKYGFSAGCNVPKGMAVDNPVITGAGIVDVGSAITLAATPSPGTWSASNGNATVSSTGVVTGVSGGTVTITYMRSTGCYATKEVTVCAPYSISIQQTVPFATTDQVISYCPDMRLEVTGAPSGSTYSWTVLPTTGIVPVPDGSGYFMFPSTPAENTYTLTVTSNSGGCTETADIVMVVNGGNCHPCEYFKPVTGSCTTVPYFKTITANVLNSGNITTGTPYYFIAKDAKLAVSPPSGDVFYMGYDVDLTVEDVITLDGLHFFSGPGLFCKWKGISVVNDDPIAGDLTITGNTLIENASSAGVQVTVGVSDAAIVPTSGHAIRSDQAIYNRNYAGIRIDHYELPLTTTTYPFSIINSVFTNRILDTYVDPAAGSSPACTDRYPFKWPTANYLKTIPGGEHTAATDQNIANYNPAFNIDAYFGIPYVNVVGVAVVNSGATDVSSPDYGDLVYGGMDYYGIQIGSTATEGCYNLFDTIVTGAYISNSNVKFYNNIFRRTPHDVTAGSGCGIHGYQHVLLLDEKKAIELGGTAGSTNNRFYNCNNGFYSSSFYTFIARNAWLSADLIDYTETSTDVNNYGFRFGNSMYGNHIMENNRFRNLYGSIVSVIPSCENPYGRIRIKENQIIDLTSHTGDEIGYYGIRVLDQSTCGTWYSHLDITDNYVQGSSWGIEVYGQGDHISSMHTSITGNEVHMMDNGRISAWTRLGIVCKQLKTLDEITGNYIHGNPAEGVTYVTYNPLPNSQGLAGYTGIDLFRVEGVGGTTADVTCNTVKDINIGFRFMHENNLNWRNNVMENNRYGMVLHSYYDAGLGVFFNGQIGHQGTNCDPMDNIWYNSTTDIPWTTTTGVYQTFTVGADPSYSKLTVRNISSGTYLYRPKENGSSNISTPPAAYGTAYSVASGTIINAGAGGCTPAIPLATDCAPSIPPDLVNKMPGNGGQDGKEVVFGTNHYTLTPNPSKGDLIITQKNAVDEMASVKVMNYAGQEVYSGNLLFANGRSTFALAKATPGMYMVVLVNEKGETSTFKVVIQ